MAPSTQKNQAKRQPIYGSDLVVDLLQAFGIEYASVNIGSTLRSICDSVVNYGNDKPKLIQTCHEEVAVAIAHGYAKASGKPMAVFLHDLVGLQHATMAIYNAWADRMPMLVLDAQASMGTKNFGHMSTWHHTANIPNLLVRDYVKWDDFPFLIDAVPDALLRARAQSQTEPMAPTYLCFDTSYLGAPLPEGFPIPDVKNKYPLPTEVKGDIDALRKVAQDVAGSDSPVFMAGHVGRKKESVGKLVKLAELVGASVIDLWECFNFPNTHPLDATDMDVIPDADVIVAFEAQTREGELVEEDEAAMKTSSLIKEGTRVYEIGLDDLLVGSWATDSDRILPADLRILSDPTYAIEVLTDICSKLIGKDPSIKRRARERIERAKVRHKQYHEKWVSDAKKRFREKPISPPRLAIEVWEKVKSSPWVIVNGPLLGWPRKLWECTEPGCYLGGSTGGGLGHGLPSSIGSAMVLQKEGKLAIDLQKDGDFLYSGSALWTASRYQVPLLIVMFNNRVYQQSANHNRLTALARKRDSAKAYGAGGKITDPNVDFAGMARSFGVYGVGPVEDPDKIGAALDEALEVVKAKKLPALVDVVCAVR